MFSISEQKIINQVTSMFVFLRKTIPVSEQRRYDFWFVYNDEGEAIDYEGGFELPLDTRFCNDFSVFPEGSIRKNLWQSVPLVAQ